MKRTLTVLAVFAVAALVSTALAATDTLQLHSPFVLNGVTLSPGEYKIAVSPTLDTVQVTKGQKVVASAPCKVGAIAQSVTRDEVHSRPDASGRDEIVRLVLSRSRMSVEILSPAGNGAGATGAVETH